MIFLSSVLASLFLLEIIEKFLSFWHRFVSLSIAVHVLQQSDYIGVWDAAAICQVVSAKVEKFPQS